MMKQDFDFLARLILEFRNFLISHKRMQETKKDQSKQSEETISKSQEKQVKSIPFLDYDTKGRAIWPVGSSMEEMIKSVKIIELMKKEGQLQGGIPMICIDKLESEKNVHWKIWSDYIAREVGITNEQIQKNQYPTKTSEELEVNDFPIWIPQFPSMSRLFVNLINWKTRALPDELALLAKNCILPNDVPFTTRPDLSAAIKAKWF